MGGKVKYLYLVNPSISYNTTQIVFIEYDFKGPEEWRELIMKSGKEQLGFKARRGRAAQNLKKLTFQEKRLILDVLDIKMTATPENVEIRAAIPIELTSVQSSGKFITTARTWGCLPFHAYVRV